MSTLIKVTYLTNGRSTLVNFDKVQSVFKIFDREKNKFVTKINFSTNEFLIVEEELQDLLRLVQEFKVGEFQSYDWVDEDPVLNIEERLEHSYHTNYPQQRNYNNRQPRRNYNNNFNY